MKRRYIKLDSVVLCEFHCTVHGRQRDFYDADESECSPDNWRDVYALGTRADIEGY